MTIKPLFLVYAVVAVLVFAGALYTARTYARYRRENVEHFTAESDQKFYGRSEQDEKVYFDIIDLYRLYLHRDPTEEELDFEFGKIQSGESSIEKLNYKIKHSLEYLRMNDPEDMRKEGSTMVDSETDVVIVRELLKELMPEADVDAIGAENILFLVSKFYAMKRDRVAFEEYYKTLPEYADYCAMIKRREEATARLNATGPEAVVDGADPRYFSQDVEEEAGVQEEEQLFMIDEEGEVIEEEMGDQGEVFVDMRTAKKKSTDGFERGGEVVTASGSSSATRDGQYSQPDAKRGAASYMVREIVDAAEEDYDAETPSLNPVIRVGDDDTDGGAMSFEIRRPNMNRRSTIQMLQERADAVGNIVKRTVTKAPSVLLRKNKIRLEGNNDADADKSTCSFYREFNRLRELDPLSSLVNSRNMDELKFHCEKEHEV